MGIHGFGYRHDSVADRNQHILLLHDRPPDARAERVDGRTCRRQFRCCVARARPKLGAVAGAVEKFKVVSEQKAREEAEAKIKQDQIAAQQRKAEMVKLADSFEAAVGEIVETVSSASSELEASAGTLTSTAERA
jgi:hypothetical protein